MKDPEGLFGPAQTGHIARLEFKRRLEKDAEAQEAFQRHVLEEKERRQALRQVRINGHFVCTSVLWCLIFFSKKKKIFLHQSRVVPDTKEELIEYFLDTEAQEMEFEIARTRQRLVFCEFHNRMLPVCDFASIRRLGFLCSSYVILICIFSFNCPFVDFQRYPFNASI